LTLRKASAYTPRPSEADVSTAAQQEEQPVASEAERAAACALAGLSGIGGQSLSLIRAAHGNLASAVQKGGVTLAEVPGLRADGIESLRKTRDLFKRGLWLLAQAQRLGARILLHGEADYPSLLASCPGAPPVLYLLGNLPEGRRRVAVVGTRLPDTYGDERTDAIVDQLCAAGVEVVSGGAVGVDKRAHQRALDRGASTVAVLGSGFIRPYPEDNEKLYDLIARHGALVSEFALDAGGIRTHFPQRNRTMAGLSEAVVLTRGTATSGALITSQTATRLGRPVFAVPGQVGDALAAAPNGLLATGARAALTGVEVVRALGLTSQAAPVELRSPPVKPAPDVSGLPVGLQQVFAQLGPAPRHIDDIAATAGLSSADVVSALLQLELAGLCIARPGKYFLRR
jgi:DNA processing protein